MLFVKTTCLFRADFNVDPSPPRSVTSFMDDPLTTAYRKILLDHSMS